MPVFEVLSGIRISVRNRGTTDLATIYQRETGATQGPSPEAAAASGTNPFITGSSGSVQFWCEMGRYDIFIEDTQVPARISPRTIQWNAVPLDGIPLSHIGVDLATQGELDAFSAAMGLITQQSNYSSRGAPGNAERWHFAGDREIMSYDDGDEWHEIYRYENKGFLQSNQYSLDGGPAHYAAGGNGLSAEIGSHGTGGSPPPAARVDITISMLYPVEFLFTGYALTYAGPGTQYHGLELQNPPGTPVFQSQAGVTSFGTFIHQYIFPAARLDALGNAGTWRLIAKGGADGVRTAGYRDITLMARERSDLV